MSDLCMCELEDNVWDEFGESDDHIVPRPGDEDGDKCAVQGDGHKKARNGVIDMTGSASKATKYVILGKEERMTKKDTMLEIDKTTDDSRMTGNCLKGDNLDSVGSGFCANHPTLVDNNSNSCDYPLSHISQTDNDLLYSGWPDIGNFEDIDRMFGSCDLTFGLGSLGNDDELCWFPPSHAPEGPEMAVKSGFKFSCPESTQSSVLKSVSEQSPPSVQNDTGPSIDDSDRKSLFLSDIVSSQTTDADEHKGQISLQRKQSKHHGGQDGKRKYCYSENGDSFHHSSDLEQCGDVKQPFGNSSESNLVFSLTDTRQHKQGIGPAPLTYMQIHAPNMHLELSNPSDQISVPSLSENNSHPSPSPKESSHASNPVRSMESSHGSLFKPSAITNEMKKWGDVQASVSGDFKHADIRSPDIVCNRVSGQKQMHRSENEIDSHSKAEGAGFPAELESSNVQESTCTSSVSDEVSPQATSFLQLQQVMEQLDIRAKLCIRDSLYRLARSAEQRHNCLNPSASGGLSNDRDVNGPSVADETNKCTGFLDIETNTNPIDRSIAHLLFHRPQDPSANDATSLKSHAMVHGSLLSPPMSQKQIFQEIAASTDNKLQSDGEK